MKLIDFSPFLRFSLTIYVEHSFITPNPPFTIIVQKSTLAMAN